MPSKQRLTELRITRNGTARTRNLCGGTVIGDYVDHATGERVLTVKVVSAANAPAKRVVRKPLPDERQAADQEAHRGA